MTAEAQARRVVDRMVLARVTDAPDADDRRRRVVHAVAVALGHPGVAAMLDGEGEA